MHTAVNPGPRPDSQLSTFYLSRDKRKCGLRVLQVASQPVHGAAAGRLLHVAGREDASRLSTLVTNTARGLFEMNSFSVEMLKGRRTGRQKTVTVLPTVFEDEADRRVRVVYKELVVRFKPGTTATRRVQALAKFGFVEHAKSPFIADQLIVSQPTVRHAGEALVAVANELSTLEEIVFSVPNFVSEFRRSRVPTLRREQWHLGDANHHDVRALEAWRITTGSPRIAIAVIDDGVDLAHPDLRARLLRNPDPKNKRDRVGRDFFVPASEADHYDPSPKREQYPYNQMDGNDIHGTACAGVAVADGKGGQKVYGIAPGCRLLPVKVFHGNELATDTRVAAAIRYAAKFARVLSCSWSGPQTPDIEFALEDIGKEHGGRGAVVCAATGNDSAASVSFPAADPNCIAVGAMTDAGTRADYSNYGRELTVVAPSGGGAREVFTTDVSRPNRGFNMGTEVPRDPAGHYTSSFSGTSSATPLVAGICALVASRNRTLSRAEIKAAIANTARKSGAVPYANGRNDEMGFGCVDAAAALGSIGAASSKGAAKKAKRKPARSKKKRRAGKRAS
jgi:subtilisin family serine protease